ncbi:uncharacterized protein LOC6565030 [Drosophila grimshawi]|uniref:GH12844 n=1 Tax=Drosophila grimshawi TaxID=7222 RepID=B4JLE4_DROGR|nr:uncharacterized protein LOC6565030 [Drosophila grimshawi]EDW00397.1 GH12844 [Drosophila grimshawi]
MASQCRWLRRRLLAFLLLPLLLMVLSTLHQSHALEFMDESAPGQDVEDDGDSAELPPILHTYSKDTISNFNPRKTDAQFRAQWERVPLQKQEVIKRR